MVPTCQEPDHESCQNDRDQESCVDETQEFLTDRDVGFFLVKLCIEALVSTNPAWGVTDLHFPEPYTTTKSWPLFVDGIKCKRMTTVFNKNKTILVLDYITPNDIDIPVADMPMVWRMVHFEKGKSFDIGSDCFQLLEPSQCHDKRFIKFIRHMANVLNKDMEQHKRLTKPQPSAAQAVIDLYLMDMCLQNLLQRNPELQRRIPAFATTGITSIQTVTHVHVNDDGKMIEDYTTILRGPHTMCILDYMLPCYVSKKRAINIHVKWNMVHCNAKKLNFRWSGYGTMARIEPGVVTVL